MISIIYIIIVCYISDIMSVKKGNIPWNKGIHTGQIPWNKGKKGLYTQTKESNKKRSEKLKNRIFSKSHIEKLSISGKKRIISDTHKENIKKSWENEERKRNISEKMKKLWKTKKYLKKMFNKNKYKNNKLEIKLQKELDKKNIKYKTHKTIIGIPDLFIEPNICIFADGDFYHGNPIKYKPTDIICTGRKKQEARKKWKYDASITKKLEEQNYIVLRFWETDINKNIEEVLYKIQGCINE